MLVHGAVILGHQGRAEHHHQRQQRVEVIGDRLHEQGEAVDRGGVLVRDVGGHGGGPRADGRDDADGRGGGVDHVGQLGAGHLEPVGNGHHDGAHRQAVEVVVQKDQAAQHGGHHQRAFLGLDPAGGPVAEGAGAAGAGKQDHDGAQQHIEEEYLQVDVVHQRQEQCFKHAPGVEICHQHGAHKAARKQGGIDLLRQKRQYDGHQRRQQRPGGTGKMRRAVGAVAGGKGKGAEQKDCCQHHKREHQRPSERPFSA